MNNFPILRISFSFLLSILLLTSCSEKDADVPSGIIEPSKMTKIFVDMQIVEAVLLHIKQKDVNANAYRKELYNKIFEKHEIKKNDFDSSFKYYSNNDVQLLDKIYADVISSLSQKQSQIKTQ